jgi:hypothetical protein
MSCLAYFLASRVLKSSKIFGRLQFQSHARSAFQDLAETIDRFAKCVNSVYCDSNELVSTLLTDRRTYLCYVQ